MLFALALLAAQPNQAKMATMTAETPRHPDQIYGFPDSDSCGTWTRYRADKTSQMLEGWVLGFVSGRNAFGAGNGDLAPGVKAEGLLGWIDQYCTANPLDSVSAAGFRLVDELQKRAKR